MIYVNQENVSEGSFVSLLENTKTNIKNTFAQKGIPKNISGLIFEEVVFDGMVECSKETDFNGHIEQTGAHAFPDIVAKKLFGVEVKMTISDKWISTGNSVLESTRVSDVETIYMFFGKFGNDFDAKYRKYQDCLYDVGVTHSPRYKIDMNLADNASIFNKINVDYDTFRKEVNPIKRLKEYYRNQLKPGEELWWIDPTSEETTVSPVIQSFALLDQSVKDRFINECIILFPEIFGSSTSKFERTAAYLITNYNAVSSHLRDYFTASGQVDVFINGNHARLPRILYNLYIRAKDINTLIHNISPQKLSYYWNAEVGDSPIETWEKILRRYSPSAVTVFEAGLNRP